MLADAASQRSTTSLAQRGRWRVVSGPLALRPGCAEEVTRAVAAGLPSAWLERALAEAFVADAAVEIATLHGPGADGPGGGALLQLALRQRHPAASPPPRAAPGDLRDDAGHAEVSVVPLQRLGGNRHGVELEGLSCLTWTSAVAGSERCAAVTRPLVESGNGDGWAVAETARWVQVAVVDGLGHGAPAAAAAQAVLAALTVAATAPLPEALRHAHVAARGTRGAAALVVRAHPSGQVEAVGVGNIAGGLAGPAAVALGSRPGVIGLRLPELHVQRLHAAPGATLLMASDGCDGRVLAGLRGDQGASRWHRAQLLHLRHARSSDDATLLLYDGAVQERP